MDFGLFTIVERFMYIKVSDKRGTITRAFQKCPVRRGRQHDAALQALRVVGVRICASGAARALSRACIPYTSTLTILRNEHAS